MNINQCKNLSWLTGQNSGKIPTPNEKQSLIDDGLFSELGCITKKGKSLLASYNDALRLVGDNLEVLKAAYPYSVVNVSKENEKALLDAGLIQDVDGYYFLNLKSGLIIEDMFLSDYQKRQMAAWRNMHKNKGSKHAINK